MNICKQCKTDLDRYAHKMDCAEPRKMTAVEHSRLSQALGIIAAECGSFILIARMGDRDDPSTWPNGQRAYAVVGAETDSDKAKAQILAAVIKWVDGEREPTETA